MINLYLFLLQVRQSMHSEDLRKMIEIVQVCNDLHRTALPRNLNDDKYRQYVIIYFKLVNIATEIGNNILFREGYFC